MDYIVGDKVVCIDDTGTNKLVDGDIYTITDINKNRGVLVSETSPTYPFTGFRGERFRKVRPSPLNNLAKKLKDIITEKEVSTVKKIKKEKK